MRNWLPTLLLMLVCGLGLSADEVGGLRHQIEGAQALMAAESGVAHPGDVGGGHRLACRQ